MSLGRLFIKKSVARIQEESQTSELKRTLGPWNLVSLGIGCIIGAGIFVMTGTAAAQHAGPAIMISFILAGIVCAFTGLCYAELASVLPVSGSAYTYAYATLGEIFAWVMGWLLVLEYGLAGSTVAVGWSGYVVSFLKDFDVLIPAALSTPTFDMIADPANPAHHVLGFTGHINVPALIGILVVTVLLVIGVSESAKVNNIIVAIKVTVVTIFIGVGMFYVNPANWHPFIPPNQGDGIFGWSGIGRAASIIFFAYVGFEAVSTAAAEAKNPQKDMPFGIIGSLVICTILYIGVSAVLTGVVPYTALNVPDPMAVAIDRINAPWATIGTFRVLPFMVKVGAITGLSSVMLVLLYGQTRIFYTMARDGLLPRFFCTVHKKFHTPWINTIVVGALVAAAAAMTPIEVLGDLVSLGTIAAFAIVCLSVMYLRYKSPELERPFRTPWMPVVPIAGILSCGGLVYGMFASESGGKIAMFMTCFLAFGFVIYGSYGYRKSRLARGEMPRTGDAVFVHQEHEERTD